MSRRQLLVVVTLPLLVVIGWVGLVWFPQHQRRNEAADRVEAAQTLKDNALVQLGAARKLASISTGTPAELAALRLRIPTEPDVGGFILLNEKLAQESGIQLTAIAPQAEVNEQFLPGADTLPKSLQPTVVGITGTGSFAAAWAYVGRLTEAQRLVVIDSIAIDVEQVGVIRCSLTVRIFSTKPTEPDASTSVADETMTKAVPQ
jgi:Tfp pilus assembly protein PilO